ncbi:tetratricopeptide repeat protein [Streptomyces endophyticus]|uniref:Tetratricopeptide repeat protein n=1 Tax=Streptomyces endophyticus TaxID=714166 RepID=A0ABU6FH45_9ACTN|nr:tetratricopeptide repeat protein [Streptomyces endophyticus]MEB8342615.1 tetratricopeptide repeat protein [Streptomyces endophyticus]
MAEPEPSMQELIRRRRRVGFIARRSELASFRANFEVPPGDERHRFLFHVHGLAGVGKTSLLKELADVAREFRVVTAVVDEAVGSVPEALSELCVQFAASGHRLKDLERRLAAHRERRYEAEAAVAVQDPAGPPTPSVGSSTAVRAGLAGLGLVPGLGPFAGAAEPNQLALGVDKVRATLSARLGNQDDVQLVMSPEKVLTPILLRELTAVAANVPWIVLFFDTYERTGSFLDEWLHDLMTTSRHGVLPSNVVVVTAGQRPLDLARWGADAAVLETMPLDPFTDDEARALLAAKGVTDEPLVAKILNVTGGLPVLVSMLANGRPTSLEDIGDPSTAAATLFLRWEREDRRDVALACALPRRLDADVFRAAVDCADDEADGLYGWLRGLAFVSDRSGRAQYHEVVRRQMLCLQRQRSPRDWSRRHVRLAEAFAQWRAEAGDSLEQWECWLDQRWRELRTAESYHRLCAEPKAALAEVLRLTVDAIDDGTEADVRGWARMLVEAGEDTEAPLVGEWGRELLSALDKGGVAPALDLLLDRAGFDAPTRGLVQMLKGRELRWAGEYEKAVAEYDRAIELDAELARAYYGRGYTRLFQGREREALADLDRALEHDPDDGDTFIRRAEAHWFLDETPEALEEIERALHVAPSDLEALALKGVLLYELGRHEEALDALGRSGAGDGDRAHAVKNQAQVHRQLGGDTDTWSDRDERVNLAPNTVLLARGRAFRMRRDGRCQEAVIECDRTLRLGGPSPHAYWNRGAAQRDLGRPDEAERDFTRALELQPDYGPALIDRAELWADQRELERALAELDSAIAGRQDPFWFAVSKGDILRRERRFDEALAAYEQALGTDEEQHEAHGRRGLCLYELERDEEALAAFGRAVELMHANVWARVRRSWVLRRMDEHERAMAELDRAVECAPTDAWALTQRGEAHRMAGDFEDALYDLDHALELDDKDPTTHGSRGAALYRLDRDEEAVAAFDRALKLDREYSWAWAYRAEVHRYLGRFEQAVSDADQAAEIDSSSTWAAGRQVTVALSMGRLDRALTGLARYEEVGGDQGWAEWKRALIHVYRGQTGAAFDVLRASRAAGREPDSEMLRLWAAVLRMAGRLDESSAVCRQLRELKGAEGEFEYAVTVACKEGVSAARPLWRRLRGSEPEELALVAAGLGEWAWLDGHLSEVLTPTAAWDDLAEFALYLGFVAAAPGADRARFAPRIAQVEQARDALQARFTAAPTETRPRRGP